MTDQRAMLEAKLAATEHEGPVLIWQFELRAVLAALEAVEAERDALGDDIRHAPHGELDCAVHGLSGACNCGFGRWQAAALAGTQEDRDE